MGFMLEHKGITGDKAERMTDDILNTIGDNPAGNAISSVKDRLMDKGWRRLGNLSDFESICGELGFTLERDVTTHGNVRRTRVTLN